MTGFLKIFGILYVMVLYHGILLCCLYGVIVVPYVSLFSLKQFNSFRTHFKFAAHNFEWFHPKNIDRKCYKNLPWEFIFSHTSTFVGSAWSLGFFIPATTANDLRILSQILSITFIFPILILEKEPVFSLLNVQC